MLWTVGKNLPFERRLGEGCTSRLLRSGVGGRVQGLVGRRFPASQRPKTSGSSQPFDATVRGYGRGIADPHGIDAFVADLNSVVPTAKKLECSDIVVLSGDRVEGASREQQHHACIESLKRGAEVADKHGLRLLLENIDQEENPKYYLTSVAEGFDIIREVNHPRVKFLYDFYHEQISEGNLIESLQRNIESGWFGTCRRCARAPSTGDWRDRVREHLSQTGRVEI